MFNDDDKRRRVWSRRGVLGCALARGLGKLLIIWGVLLPLITLPSTAFGPYGVIPLLEISLRLMTARIGPLPVAYDMVVVGALVLVSVGLSFLMLPKARR